MSADYKYVSGRCGIQEKHKPHSGHDSTKTWECDGKFITVTSVIPSTVSSFESQFVASEAAWACAVCGHLHDVKPGGFPTTEEKAALLAVFVNRMSAEAGNDRTLEIARAWLKELGDTPIDEGIRAFIDEELSRGGKPGTKARLIEQLLSLKIECCDRAADILSRLDVKPGANADLIAGLEQMKSLGGTHLHMSDFGIPIDTFIAALEATDSQARVLTPEQESAIRDSMCGDWLSDKAACDNNCTCVILESLLTGGKAE